MSYNSSLIIIPNSNSSITKSSSSSSYNKLVRLARVARLYRLLRIVRLFKIFKILRYSQLVQDMMDRVKMNAAAGRMIMILILGFFSVHLVSCLWFIAAKFDDFNPSTWTFRMNLIDRSSYFLYLESLYWSL